MDYCEFDHWEFVYDEALHWTWRRVAADGHLRMPSVASFATMDDCVCNAKLYGFVDHEAMDEIEGDDLCLNDEPTARSARTAMRHSHARR